MLAARTSAAAAARRCLGARRTYASVVDAAGVRVATTDPGAPTASVTLLVKAGPRFENKPGVAHILKNFAFKATEKRTALGTVRETELYGGILSTTLSREHLAVTAEFLKGDEEYFVDLLTSFATQSKFARYEFTETVLPTTADETAAALADPTTRALEMAHALAFRNGLSASLFAPAHPHVTEKDVQTFAHSVFAKSNMAFVGTGIEESVLAKLVEKGLAGAQGSSSSLSSTASKYFGGESRLDAASGAQTAFIGFATAGGPSAELAALAAHLSPASAVKWAQGTSPIAAGGLLPAGASVRTVLLPYSDATLFGLLVQGASTQDVRTAGEVAVRALKEAGQLKAEDAQKAVAKAKFAAASAIDGRDGYVATVGPKVLAGSEASVTGLVSAFEKVDAAAINSAASSLLKAKPTYVVVGDLAGLPYADELGL